MHQAGSCRRLPPLLLACAAAGAVWCVQERGWNALEFSAVRDCWARDIGTVNADNAVAINGKCRGERGAAACAGTGVWQELTDETDEAAAQQKMAAAH